MKKDKVSDAVKNEREQLIFNQDYDPTIYKRNGGIRGFKSISFSTIQKLLENHHMEMSQYMTGCKVLEDFVNFVEIHNPENWYFHGYTVSYERNDTAVVIEGIGSHKPLSEDDLIDFIVSFRYADDLDAEKDQPVYCWYD